MLSLDVIEDGSRRTLKIESLKFGTENDVQLKNFFTFFSILQTLQSSFKSCWKIETFWIVEKLLKKQFKQAFQKFFNDKIHSFETENHVQWENFLFLKFS